MTKNKGIFDGIEIKTNVAFTSSTIRIVEIDFADRVNVSQSKILTIILILSAFHMFNFLTMQLVFTYLTNVHTAQKRYLLYFENISAHSPQSKSRSLSCWVLSAVTEPL